jgi:uncharacterized oxidoreductase
VNVTGNTVLVTGGSSGIGMALVEAFLKKGNRVIIAGRNEDKLTRLKTLFPAATAIACDIGNPGQLEQFIAQMHRSFPDLNVLVNNAGIQYHDSFAGSNPLASKISEEISVNLTAPIALCAGLLPLLVTKKQAAIVNISSALGLIPKSSAPVYCASKAGIHLFTKALRYQLEHTPVKVFEVFPPAVDTQMTAGAGKSKMRPDELADAFMSAFRMNLLEIPVGKVKWLKLLHRLSPSLAERLVKNS